MWGEPFAAGMLCPICNKMTDHLIILDMISFKEKLIYFDARCSMCEKVSFMMHGKPSQPFHYKCDYLYWSEIEPEIDEPCKN